MCYTFSGSASVCVCVHLGEGHPHFERVLDMPDVDFTWLVFVRMSIRLFAGEMGEKCQVGLNRSDGNEWGDTLW